MSLLEPSRYAFRQSPLFREMERIGRGEKPLPETDAAKHHFVPKFQLRGFSTDRKHVFQLDIDRGRPEKKGIKEAAMRLHFYEFEGADGSRSNRFEAFLGIVETHAAPALRRLVIDPYGLSDPDRATISYYLALLGSRTPGGRAQGVEMQAQSMQLMLATHVSDIESFAAFHRERHPDATDEEIRDLRQRMLDGLTDGSIDFPDPAANATRMGMHASADVAQEIFGFDWRVMHSDQQDFITCDRGLAMYDPDPPYPWTGNAWRSSEQAETTVPIDANHCLLVTPGQAQIARVELEASRAMALNLRTYGWADEFIYGRTQEVVAAVRRAAKRRPQRVVRPKPFHMALLVEGDPTDTSLADEHRRRGWPAYLPASDETGSIRPHDYLVIGVDGRAVETAEKAVDLVKRRARGPGKPAIKVIPRAQMRSAGL